MDEDNDDERKPKDQYKFEEILLEALELAQETERPYWAELILTVLTAIQEDLEEELAMICESFLRKTAEAQKQNEELLPFHFVVSRVGCA